MSEKDRQMDTSAAEQVSPFIAAKRLYRAKIIAGILTENGMPVYAPDEATLDDVERERWSVCVEIERAMREMLYPNGGV